MNRLFLIGGVSGSGKSDVALFLQKHTNAAIVAADDFRYVDGEYVHDSATNQKVHQQCQRFAREQMKAGTSTVAVHNTFTTRKEMRPYLDMAERHNYRVHVVTCQNYHNGVSSHNVPDDALRAQARRFEFQLVPDSLGSAAVPSLAECLDRLRFVPQRPDWHPEIWVYDHIAMVTGQLIAVCQGPHSQDLELMAWAGLMHDLGKWDTTVINRNPSARSYGQLISYNHDDVAADTYCPQLLPLYLTDSDLIEDITWLVRNHMRIRQNPDALRDHRLFPKLQMLDACDSMVILFETSTPEDRQTYISVFERWFEARELTP